MTDKLLRLTLQADLDLVSREAQTERILAIGIRAPEAEKHANRPALNLALVLDRSGSMSGEKLNYVKHAAVHVIGLLEERDRVALVAYDDEVSLLAPSLPVTPGNRQILERAIRPLRSGATTNLSGGWLTGCEQVAKAAQEGSLNRTLLLTDGLANVGITDLEELAGHARELSQRGVTTSTFGVGRDYHQQLLEAMANQGTGNYYFIETPQDIPGIFAREFQELAAATAQDVEIVLELPPGLQARPLGDWRVECAGNQMRIFLGSLYSSRLQEVFIKLKAPPAATGEELAIKGLARGKDETGAILEAKQQLVLRYASQAEVDSAHPDEGLLERFALVDLAQTAHEALKLEKIGERDQAHQMLQGSLKANRPHVSAAQASEYQWMSDRMAFGMDDVDRKQSHYRTYLDKKQRIERREYPLERPEGLLLIEADGRWVLIDTGAPISFGTGDGWHFMGHRHPISPDYMGVTAGHIGQFLGTRIDIVLGMDILKQVDFRIDTRRRTVTFSSDPVEPHGIALPTRAFMGVPIAGCRIAEKDLELYFDTGAKLTYLSSERVKGYPVMDKANDFYPGVGEFETPVYEIPVIFAGEALTLRCGILPTLLEMSMKMTGVEGLLGTEILDHFLVDCSFRRDVVWLNRIKAP